MPKSKFDTTTRTADWKTPAVRRFLVVACIAAGAGLLLLAYACYMVVKDAGNLGGSP